MEKEYSGECFGAFESGYSIGYRQAQRDLSKLIERDKAKKPVKKSDIEDEWTAGVYCCPSCGGDLWEFDFCHDCGQRIDWEESNEY